MFFWSLQVSPTAWGEKCVKSETERDKVTEKERKKDRQKIKKKKTQDYCSRTSSRGKLLVLPERITLRMNGSGKRRKEHDAGQRPFGGNLYQDGGGDPDTSDTPTAKCAIYQKYVSKLSTGSEWSCDFSFFCTLRQSFYPILLLSGFMESAWGLQNQHRRFLCTVSGWTQSDVTANQTWSLRDWTHPGDPLTEGERGLTTESFATYNIIK